MPAVFYGRDSVKVIDRRMERVGLMAMYRLDNSLVGRVGKAIEPAIRPLGFDWKIGTALIGATAAKELFVSQLAIIYAEDNYEHTEKSLSRKLQADYTPLTAFCAMLFCLIYAPCAATVAMTRNETASWAWALFQFFALTALAYVVTLIVNQMGLLIGG
jgi:ferrous iron transport protein B